MEDPPRAKCSWHASCPPLLPLLPPLPGRTHNFNPPRLQEGISLAAFDAADEKWSKKAPWRCPAGSRPSGLQRLYADHSLVTRRVPCLAPRPISPTLPPVLFTLGMSRGNIYTRHSCGYNAHTSRQPDSKVDRVQIKTVATLIFPTSE